MQYPLTTVLAAAAFAVGLVIAQPVQARGDTISDEEAGMVCDETTLGYYLDIDFRLYQCDGRDWVNIGGV